MWFHFLHNHFSTELVEVLIFAGQSPNSWFDALQRTRYNYIRWLFAYLKYGELIMFKKQCYGMLEWIPVNSSKKWLNVLRLVLFEAIHEVHVHRILKQFEKDSEWFISKIYFVIWELFVDWWTYYDFCSIYPIYSNYLQFSFWLQLVKYNLD